MIVKDLMIQAFVFLELHPKYSLQTVVLDATQWWILEADLKMPRPRTANTPVMTFMAGIIANEPFIRAIKKDARLDERRCRIEDGRDSRAMPAYACGPGELVASVSSSSHYPSSPGAGKVANLRS
jgi:hypothetical protein